MHSGITFELKHLGLNFTLKGIFNLFNFELENVEEFEEIKFVSLFKV